MNGRSDDGGLSAGKRKILLVEDDANLSKILCLTFESEGIQVCPAFNIALANAALASQAFDLMIVDVELPDGNGFDFVASSAVVGKCPVIFLTSRSSETERIHGLRLGADDYVTKPFSTQELLLRMTRSINRGAQQEVAKRGDPVSAGLHINIEGLTVLWGGRSLDFTPTEVRLLALLWQHRGRVCTRQLFLDKLPGDRLELSDRSIDAHVKRIRKKLEPTGLNPVKTVRGVGYKYEVS